MRVTLGVLLAGSALLRATLILWGVFQDRMLRVPYTDVDYKVFTDAARLVVDGKSPFLRSTYRYTPLLAYVVVPNVLLTPLWGKILFSAADLLAGWQLWRLARLQGASPSAAVWAAAAWLCNPFTFAISTRGSCDSLVVVMLLGLLLMLARGGGLVLPALLYGLAVHVRIYPIIYAPSIVLFLGRRQALQRLPAEGAAAAAASASAGGEPAAEAPAPSRRCLALGVLRQGAVFGSVSGGAFLALGLAFYHLYGRLFLLEGFLHHLTRKDPRHCFSVHWYSVYLTFLPSWPSGPAAAAEQGLSAALGAPDVAPAGGAAVLLDPARLAALPQAVALLALALALHEHLPFCWLVQTVVFVAFNKVSTAQYFVWWFCLLPASFPGLLRGWPPPRALSVALGAWAAAQVHWLLWGYLLEFEGRPVHLALWSASLVFLAANSALVVALLRCWRPPRSFLQLSLEMEAGGGGGSGPGPEVGRESAVRHRKQQ